MDASERIPIRTDCALFPKGVRDAALQQFGSPQCDSLYCRERGEVATTAGVLWELAHDLHPDARVGQSGCAGAGVRVPAAGANYPTEDRSRFVGQHFSEGPSRRHKRAKKNGPQSIGRSRGGLTTKIHLVAGDERTALCFSLYSGQGGDAPAGHILERGKNRSNPPHSYTINPRQLSNVWGPLHPADRIPCNSHPDLSAEFTLIYENCRRRSVSRRESYR